MGVKLTTKGAYVKIRGYVDVFANLPLATHHDEELWIVLRGSQPKVPLTKWYEYPAGLYISAEDEWQIAPMSVEFAEISSLQANITDWGTFYNSLDYVNAGTSIRYNGKIYANITGNATTTPPNLDITNWASKVAFDLTNTALLEEGEVGWNVDDGTLQIGLPGGTVVGQVFMEMLLPKRVRNVTGQDLPNGTPVYLSGATGGVSEVTMADASDQDNSRKLIALLTESIINNGRGYATNFGLVRDVDTSGFVEGDELFLAVGGGFTNVMPSLPNAVVKIGVCNRSHATEGEILVNITPKSVKELLTDSGDLTVRTAANYTAVLEQPVYKDINLGGIALRSGAVNQPTLINLSSTTILVNSFSGSQTNEVHGAFELQHDYKEGTDLLPHFHWYTTTTNTGVTRWGLEYYIVNLSGGLLANNTIYITDTAEGVAWQPKVIGFPIIPDNNFTIGSQMHIRFFRDGTNVADTYADSAAIATVGVHYQIDTLGSRQLFIK